jgi:preprotein translocase subunit SecE
VSEDRDKEREEGQERPSRPVTAAARRERRASARPAARKDSGESPVETPKAKPRSAPSGKPDAAADEKKGKATPARDRKDKKPSPPARLLRFLREVVSELRKVIWPTRKQMVTYTAVVLVFLAVMVAIVAGLDLGIGKGVFAVFG